MTTQAASVRANLVKILDGEIAEQVRLLQAMRDTRTQLENLDVSAPDAEAQIVAIGNSLYAGLERSI